VPLKTLLACGMVLAIVAASATAAETFYRLTDIGAVPWDSAEGARGTAMNSEGDIAGVSFNPSPTIRAFFWDSKTGGMTELLGLFGGTDDFTSASAINDRGDVVGLSIKEIEGLSPTFALIWQPRSYQVVELAPPANCRFASAEAINDRGVVALYSCAGGGFAHAYVRSPDGTFIDLGVLPGDDLSFPVDINRRGQVVGSSWRAFSNVARAFKWDPRTATMSELPGVDGLQASVSAINDQGYAVGVAGQSRNEDRAVVWDPSGAITELGNLPGGRSLSSATDINRKRQIVGWAIANFTSYAVLWEQGLIKDLNALIQPSDPLRGCVELHRAIAINDRGQIAAEGRDHCASAARTYLLSPVRRP
jgi:probable HAF family extracellular repeat protein